LKNEILERLSSSEQGTVREKWGYSSGLGEKFSIGSYSYGNDMPIRCISFSEGFQFMVDHAIVFDFVHNINIFGLWFGLRVNF
jgi:hypothetical protein